MDISKLTLAWKFITGGKTGVMDYLFDCANNVIAKISNGTKEEILKYIEYAKKIIKCLRACDWMCPAKWKTAYNDTVTAFEAVVIAFEDFEITENELMDVIQKFQKAYSEWRAE